MCGIILQQSQQNLHRFNLKNLALIILASFYEISQIKLLDDASNLEEYTDIIHGVLAVMIYIIFYINIVWNTRELFELVDRLEKNINNSK